MFRDFLCYKCLCGYGYISLLVCDGVVLSVGLGVTVCVCVSEGERNKIIYNARVFQRTTRQKN